MAGFCKFLAFQTSTIFGTHRGIIILYNMTGIIVIFFHHIGHKLFWVAHELDCLICHSVKFFLIICYTGVVLETARSGVSYLAIQEIACLK